MKVKKEKSVRQFRKRFVDSKSVVIRLSTCYVFLDRWIVLTLDFLDWFSGMAWIYGNLTVVLTLQSIVDRWVGFISWASVQCDALNLEFVLSPFTSKSNIFTGFWRKRLLFGFILSLLYMWTRIFSSYVWLFRIFKILLGLSEAFYSFLAEWLSQWPVNCLVESCVTPCRNYQHHVIL